MPLSTLVDGTVQAIRQHYLTKRLLLVHPSTRYRGLVVAQLINNPPCQVYYHAVTADVGSALQFAESLTHSLSLQTPGFGRATSHLIKNDVHNQEHIVSALINDLADLNNDHYLLILDDFDLLEASPPVETFVNLVIDALPEHCHLLINGRRMPSLPWIAYVARQQAVVLGDFEAEQRYTASGPNVEVRGLGSGTVRVDGNAVPWEGQLPKLLFFFGLDRASVTREEVCEAFWPDLPADQAVNIFHVTKRRLHRILGFTALQHRSGQYVLNPQINLTYDVMDFVRCIARGRTLTYSDAAMHWQRAIHLYRGQYLRGYTEPWVVQRREDFHASYVEALRGLAHARLQSRDYEQALGLFLQAASEGEDVHHVVMDLYTKLDRPEEARHYFRQLANEYEARGVALPQDVQRAYERLASR